MQAYNRAVVWLIKKTNFAFSKSPLKRNFSAIITIKLFHLHFSPSELFVITKIINFSACRTLWFK